MTVFRSIAIEEKRIEEKHMHARTAWNTSPNVSRTLVVLLLFHNDEISSSQLIIHTQSVQLFLVDMVMKSLISGTLSTKVRLRRMILEHMTCYAKCGV